MPINIADVFRNLIKGGIVFFRVARGYSEQEVHTGSARRSESGETEPVSGGILHHLRAISGREIVKVYANLSRVMLQTVVGSPQKDARPSDIRQMLFRFALLVAVRGHGAEFENRFAPFAITDALQHIAGGSRLQCLWPANIKSKRNGGGDVHAISCSHRLTAAF
jgi:hypothetical protein